MNRERSFGESIGFFWAPTAYPVLWADSPDEVPPWDVSRDFPKEVGAGYKGRPQPEDPYKVEELRLYLCDHVDYKNHTETWEPTPAPKSGYPRLVRASVKMMPLDQGYHQNDDVIGALAPLAKYIQPWRENKPVKVLKKKILELANLYGPPGEANQNTLEAWLGLITFVDVHLSTLLDFKLNGLEMMLGKLRDKCDELENLKVVDEDATRRARKHAERKRDLSKYPFSAAPIIMLKDLDPIQHLEFGYTKELLSSYKLTATGKHSAQSYRTEVADNLFNLFNLLIEQRDWDHQVKFAPWGTILKCPLKSWVVFKMSKLWRDEKPVKVCPVCGTLFLNTHANQKYCRGGTCAGKVYDSKRPNRNRKARTKKVLTP